MERVGRRDHLVGDTKMPPLGEGGGLHSIFPPKKKGFIGENMQVPK